MPHHAPAAAEERVVHAVRGRRRRARAAARGDVRGEPRHLLAQNRQLGVFAAGFGFDIAHFAGERRERAFERARFYGELFAFVGGGGDARLRVRGEGVVLVHQRLKVLLQRRERLRVVWLRFSVSVAPRRPALLFFLRLGQRAHLLFQRRELARGRLVQLRGLGRALGVRGERPGHRVEAGAHRRDARGERARLRAGGRRQRAEAGAQGDRRGDERAQHDRSEGDGGSARARRRCGAGFVVSEIVILVHAAHSAPHRAALRHRPALGQARVHAGRGEAESASRARGRGREIRSLRQDRRRGVVGEAWASEVLRHRGRRFGATGTSTRARRRVSEARVDGVRGRRVVVGTPPAKIGKNT